jgi:hypothetical protein
MKFCSRVFARNTHTADRQNVVINTIFFVLGPRFCGLFTLGFVGVHWGIFGVIFTKVLLLYQALFCLSVAGVVAEKKG